MSFYDVSRQRRLFRKKRHLRVKKKIIGTAERPRVSVFRSSRHIYAHLVDDVNRKVITTISTLSKDFKSSSYSGNVESSLSLGKFLAKVLKEKGLKTVVFDKGGYRYHGRVKALADSLREEGIEF